MFFVSTYYRKIFNITVLASTLMAGWWVFAVNRHHVINLEPYHLKSYALLAASLPPSFTSTRAADASETRKAIAIPVLTYHGILKENERVEGAPANEGVSVSIDVFKDQMAALKKAGYQTITLGQLLAFMRKEIPLPDKSFILTFDDGRRDSYYPADPILAAYDYHAVMFVITKNLSEERSNYYLNIEELAAMEQSGRWEIQSHGRDSHDSYPIDSRGSEGYFMSNKLWREDKRSIETDDEFLWRVQRDLIASKIDIESHFSTPVIGFSFPFGDFGYGSENFPDAEVLVPKAAAHAYPLLFYQTSFNGSRFTTNYNDTPKDGSFFIKRIGVEADWTGVHLLKVLEAARPKMLPFVAALDERDGWIRGWGDFETMSNILVMRPRAGDTGSVVILNGTRHWRQYDFRVRVQSVQGSNIYLYARFLDDRNFVGCNLGKGIYQIEQTLQGERRVIKSVARNAPYPEGEFEVGVRVQGRRVECLVDDVIVVDTDVLAPELGTGGIGLKAWDTKPDRSELTVTKVSATYLEEAAPPFSDDFSSDMVIEETAYAHQSTHSSWWLNSGGEFHLTNGIGRTLQDDEAPFSWREEYVAYNPIDSDQGVHPQNLLRLIYKGKEKDVRIESQFRIRRDHASVSPERGQANGVLLLLRYLDEDNLYYAGLRVDGMAIIKKKSSDDGYYILKQKTFYPGRYDRVHNSSLLPKNEWIGVRAEAKNHENGTVAITLFVDQTGTGEWVKVLEAIDDGIHFGGPAITQPGYTGIRTDFMDVEFDNVKVTHLFP